MPTRIRQENTLLAPHEPPPVLVERADGKSAFFITCDHASKRIPASLGSLGVSAIERARHIGWDIGALGVSRALSAYFDACLVATQYSRLVIDCNRNPARADAIPTQSELTPVPGNLNLSEAARALRCRALWEPYHQTITALLDARQAVPRSTIYVAVHSFTPRYKEESRPWQVALLSNRDRRLADILLRELGKDPALCVGDNIPYRLSDDTDYGVPVHAERRGLPHVLLELRQDEIESATGQRAWAARLRGLLTVAAAELNIPL